jgi:hypothetical protein
MLKCSGECNANSCRTKKGGIRSRVRMVATVHSGEKDFQL